jgi:hypothetical protein
MPMDAPDWTRARVNIPDASNPLGDPIRWGGTVVQPIAQTLLAQFLISEQIIRVACLDGYPRNWSLIGSVNASSEFWEAPPNPSHLDVAPTGVGFGAVSYWYVAARVRMGVGQGMITHNIDLRATMLMDAPFYLLSPTDASGTLNMAPETQHGNAQERAFIIPGAIIGSDISIQIQHYLAYSVLPSAPFTLPKAITTTLLIVPVAGSGM